MTAANPTKGPHTAAALVDDSVIIARQAGVKALCRVFVRPNRKGWPARTQLLIVARHRRAVSSKSR